MCAVFCTGISQAYADIGTITVDGSTRSYSSLSDLADDLDDYEGKTITVDMLTDWNASYGADQFDCRLYFPSDCNATFNMHGYIFDRDNVYDGDADVDGELIYVDTGVTLTINGHSSEEERQRVHDRVHIFTDVEQETTNNRFISVNGGCLTGGNGYAGTGGIYIDSGKKVTINDVTIAGCMANWNFWYSGGGHSGYGGAILITEGSTTVSMKNCTITGCLAEDDGGAIFSSQYRDNVRIELDNTHIDKNYANSDGGGIDIDGENGSITATRGSSIRDNKCEGYGGGVYLWNDGAPSRQTSWVTLPWMETRPRGAVASTPWRRTRRSRTSPSPTTGPLTRAAAPTSETTTRPSTTAP